jgi:2-polyprenyl-3-methyl-5-hydroxy-6-metoxy-1,4-benzoquinol methylase
MLRRFVHTLGRTYVRRVCRSEFEHQSFRVHNERPIEFGFALAALAGSRPRTVLDVGTGTTAWPHLLRNCGFVVTAIDNVRDYWASGMTNRHWTVLDVDIVDPQGLDGEFEAITCISVLEHIEDHATAVRNMHRYLAPGGLLILTTPFSAGNPCPNVYARPDALYGQQAAYICRSSSQAELDQWLSCGFSLERQELWRLFTGPVWATGERSDWQRVTDPAESHQLGCFALRKR